MLFDPAEKTTLHNGSAARPGARSSPVQPLCPSYLLQILPRLRRQVLVDGHQVVPLPSRFPEPPCQEVVKRTHVLQPPVLPRPHFAEIPAKLDETGVALHLSLSAFPRQDLVDLGEAVH